MANRALLLNSRLPSNDCFALYEQSHQAGRQVIEVASASYRIPVPWMCLFRPQDLQPFSPRNADVFGEQSGVDGQAIAYQRAIPFTSVAAARLNLQAAWPVYEALANQSGEDPEEEARELWEAALAGLDGLPFEYLTVSVDEVIDDEAEHASFVAALSADLTAVPHLLACSRAEGDLASGLDAFIWQAFDADGEPLPSALTQGLDCPTWQRAWARMAARRGRQTESDWQNSCQSLDQYVEHGFAPLSPWQTAYAMFRVGADAQPPPFEWEWSLDIELRAYAECLQGEVQADNARGLAFNAERARQAFAAHATAQSIVWHRLLLCQPRACSHDNIRMDSEAVLYTALGLVAGCEEQALRSARMLCAARRRHDYLNLYGQPSVRFIFKALSVFLQEPIRPLEGSMPSPALDALLADDLWLKADAQTLAPRVLAACIEHTHSTPKGPFRGLPMAVMLVFKLRSMRNLANPPFGQPPIHPLLAVLSTPLPTKVDFSAAIDPRLMQVRQRMQGHGFDEAAIYDAMIRGVTLPALAATTAAPPPDGPPQRPPWWKFW